MRAMKNTMAPFVCTLILATGLHAQEAKKIDFPQASSSATVKERVGVTDVSVEYSRPNMRERKIFGGLVPYGQVWRTGADEATAITFAKDVLVEGQKLAAGTYALFTIPGEKEWTVIFNRTAEQWGAFDYDAKQDALRVTVKPAATQAPVESLDFVIEGARVALRWEKLAVGFEVKPAA